MSDQPTPPQRRSLDVRVGDDERQGTYANLLVVSHGPHEFTLDFCQVNPGANEESVAAEVVSRVRIAPTMVAQVLNALNTNLSNYEDRFGQVKAIG